MVERKPKLHDQVRYTQVVDEMVLLAQEDGKVHGVNAVGAFLIPLLDGSHTLQDLVTQVVEHFEVKEEEAKKDIEAFLKDLESQNLIIYEEGL